MALGAPAMGGEVMIAAPPAALGTMAEVASSQSPGFRAEIGPAADEEQHQTPGERKSKRSLPELQLPRTSSSPATGSGGWFLPHGAVAAGPFTPQGRLEHVPHNDSPLTLPNVPSPCPTHPVAAARRPSPMVSSVRNQQRVPDLVASPLSSDGSGSGFRKLWAVPMPPISKAEKKRNGSSFRSQFLTSLKGVFGRSAKESTDQRTSSKSMPNLTLDTATDDEKREVVPVRRHFPADEGIDQESAHRHPLENPDHLTPGGKSTDSTASQRTTPYGSFSPATSSASSTNWEWCANNIYPLVPGKLSFSIHRDERATLTAIKQNPSFYFFSCDCQEQYQPFAQDFGPVDLGVVHAFLEYMKTKMDNPRLQGKHPIYYCDINTSHRTNAAFLLGCFMIMEYDMAPEEAASPFLKIKPTPFRAFRDASAMPSTYDLGLLDCLRAFHKSVKLGWYDPKKFNLRDYDVLGTPLCGNLHQVCDKFVAFRGPTSSRKNRQRNAQVHLGANRPQQYIDVFQSLGVQAVVRLNEPSTYDAGDFTSRGVQHHDLFFEDCSVPSADVVERFLDISNSVDKLAVHCLAGLGRTGTLIAVWMIKHEGFTASEAIAWLRIVRPGSVIGLQQHFLEELERAKWNGNRPILDEDLDLVDKHIEQEMATEFRRSVYQRECSQEMCSLSVPGDRSHHDSQQFSAASSSHTHCEDAEAVEHPDFQDEFWDKAALQTGFEEGTESQSVPEFSMTSPGLTTNPPKPVPEAIDDETVHEISLGREASPDDCFYSPSHVLSTHFENAKIKISDPCQSAICEIVPA